MITKYPYTGRGVRVSNDGALIVDATTQTEIHEASESGNGYCAALYQSPVSSIVPLVSGSYVFYLSNDSVDKWLIIDEICMSSNTAGTVITDVEIDNSATVFSNYNAVVPVNNNTDSSNKAQVTCHVWDGTAAPMVGVLSGVKVKNLFLGQGPSLINMNATRVIGPGKSISLFMTGDGTTKVTFFVNFYFEEIADR